MAQELIYPRNFNGIFVEDTDYQWNCKPDNRCKNDMDFFIPYLAGDPIYLQTISPALGNGTGCNDNGECDGPAFMWNVSLEECCTGSQIKLFDNAGFNGLYWTWASYKYHPKPFINSVECYQNMLIETDICGCCIWYYRTEQLPYENGTIEQVFALVNGVFVDVTLDPCYTISLLANTNNTITIQVKGCKCEQEQLYVVIDPQNGGGFEQFVLNVYQKDCSVTPPLINKCFYVRLEEPVLQELNVYTQQYKCIDCGDNTVALEGEYNKFDCDGYFYGEDNFIQNGTGQPVPFCSNQYYTYYPPNNGIPLILPSKVHYKKFTRVYGTFRQVASKVERTLSDSCFPVSSKVTRRYKLSTGLMPYWYMNEVQATLGAKTIKVNGVEYVLREDPRWSESGIKGNTMFSLEAIFEECACTIEHGC